MKEAVALEQDRVVAVDPRVDPMWRDLVEHTCSSVFHSPSWLRVLTETYGWETEAYVVLDEHGNPKGGIPFCRITDMLGKRVVALPFSDYCDPLAGDPLSLSLLIDEMLQEQSVINLRCLHNNLPLFDQRLRRVKQAKWHRLNLSPDLDTLWRGLHDSLHRAIKKSQREGVVVFKGQSEEDLRAFYEMHLKVRKHKYGLLAQPFRFFQNIWRQFVETHQGFLLLAAYQDRIVAGDLFLVWKDTLYYKFNASLPEELSHRPNDLVTWEGIQLAKSQGLSFLDFGLSDWEQEGLARYKRKFGAEEKTISFLKYSPGETPSCGEKEMRDLLSRLTQRFTDQGVPDSVTEIAGEELYRFFV